MFRQPVFEKRIRLPAGHSLYVRGRPTTIARQSVRVVPWLAAALLPGKREKMALALGRSVMPGGTLRNLRVERRAPVKKDGPPALKSGR